MIRKVSFALSLLVLGMLVVLQPWSLQSEEKEAPKKIVFVAGTRSHGYGAHEFNAGCLLMEKMLKEQMPDLVIEVHQNGWPEDPEKAFEGAATVVIFCNGGGGHVVMPHLEEFDKVMKRGVGLVCMHYAVEVPIGPAGKYMLDWIGGYFETDWSVNPHWTADFQNLPEHEVTRGVEPFEINDEWYYHMRFREDMDEVAPVLSAHPPKETLERPDGPHSGNPAVREAVANGEIQHVAWTHEREDGGRGFGITGFHYHSAFANDDMRKLTLNAILWTAKIPVPENGLETPTPTQEELEANQDYPKPN